MDDKITYWASVTFGAASLILLVLNVSFVNSNRMLQDEVGQRQAAITRAQTLGQVDQGIVQALASASVKDGDTQARDLLAAQGITVKQNGSAAAAASPAEGTSADARPVKRKFDKRLDKVNEEVLP